MALFTTRPNSGRCNWTLLNWWIGEFLLISWQCASRCSIAATFFTLEYCMKLTICPNKKRWGCLCFREKIIRFPAFFWIRWTLWTLWPSSPSSCPPSCQVPHVPAKNTLQTCRTNSGLQSMKMINKAGNMIRLVYISCPIMLREALKRYVFLCPTKSEHVFSLKD